MEKENNIDYFKLIKALDYFKSKGFNYLNLDWIVDENISSMTKPLEKKDYFIDDKVLVASAEQTFLQMMIDNKLSNGRYVGITPCFRDEKEDYLHNKYFMKVELIDTLNVNYKSLEEIINICLEFFNKYIKSEIIKIDEDNFDIIDSLNKIELGSYGIRKFGDMSWIYATGLAEPRLTRIINLK